MSWDAALPEIAAGASVEARRDFIRKTYVHLGGAIAACVALTAVLVNTVGAQMTSVMMGGRFSWLIVLGLFMGVGHMAEKWARTETDPRKQYRGLALYVVVQSIILTPMLFVASHLSDPSVIAQAGVLTLMIFGGLTAAVFTTKEDFSWMRGALGIVGFGAMGLIVVSLLFGFNLGTWFSLIMVVLASAYILYYTSNVLHHYRVGSHVAASLALFAAVALLFWYLLSFFMSSGD